MRKCFLLSTIFVFLTACAYLPTGKVLAADKVEINTASLQQLDQIIGIGPALAQRVIDARPFSSVDDLLKVKGIGEKTLQKIKDQGLAYVAQQSTQEATPTPAPPAPEAPIPSPSPAPTPTITYPSGIFISEILPAPEGSDEENEWIELYNANTIEVNLQDWKLQDIEGTAINYIFPKDAKIAALGYVVLKRPETKITLNNDRDGLGLFSPNGKIMDSMLFQKAPKNQSYAKMNSQWSWNPNLTPGAENIIITKTDKTLPNPQKTDTTYVAAAAESINLILGNPDDAATRQSNPWFLFLTAIAITIIFAIIILLVKFKVLKILNRKS